MINMLNKINKKEWHKDILETESLAKGTLVRVFKNLTKDIWSVQIKTVKGWRVVGYSEEIRLDNAKPVVSEKGRLRVLREKKKYVHAFIEGEWNDGWTLTGQHELISYNPYMFGSFYTVPVHDLGGKKHGSYNPVSSDWKGTVYLNRDSQSNRLTTWREVA